MKNRALTLAGIIIISVLFSSSYIYGNHTVYAEEPTPTATSANLICQNTNLSFVTDGGLYLLVAADIVNTGSQTAYNVSIHVETWFSDGTKGMDIIVWLNDQMVLGPRIIVNIDGGSSYTLHSRWHGNNLPIIVPTKFWLDSEGRIYPYDLISNYTITPIWNDMTPPSNSIPEVPLGTLLATTTLCAGFISIAATSKIRKTYKIKSQQHDTHQH